MSRSRTTAPSAGAVADEVQAILKEKNPGEQLAKLRASHASRRRSSSGRSSATSSTTAPCTSATSRTARATSTSPSAGASAGQRGPFELWQAAGWQQVAKWIAEDIAAGKTMAEGAAARSGCTRRPHGRAFGRGLVLRGDRQDGAALDAARVRAPALPRDGPRREAGRSRHHGLRGRGRAHVAPGRRHRHRLLQEQDAFARQRGAAWA